MSINRERLEQKFQEEYNRLNEKQRLAVNTIEGPVMVIAGPGTGKTQILASRIGKILLDTDAIPENILCLTYTDAGVVAMRKRLQQFIGPAAYKVNLYTFHAFCNDIIQDNLSFFEKTQLDPISDLERIELLKELIDSFPKEHPLKRFRGDVHFEVNNLQQLFSAMKKENWTAEFIYQKIDEYINDLPNRDGFVAKRAAKEFKKGDIRTDKVQEESEKMNKLKAAVGEFERFQLMMRARNRYDFDDMINWVIKAFSEHKNLLAQYQEKYQYILVDEYQDTSGSQNKLVELLINYWERPNIFVVGDDDQSIYRFQGANVENMLEFASNYQKDLLTVILANNYRSNQPILDVSKTLINTNTERLVSKIEGLSKELIAALDKRKAENHLPIIQEYESQRQEMIGTASQVRNLIAQGVPPGRIGIIYKEHKYGEELTTYFQQLKLPVYSKRQLNLLHQPIAKKIFLVLEYLSSELDVPYSGDEMLFEILHFDWFGIPPIEIAKLSMETSQRRYKNENTSIRQLLTEKRKGAGNDLFTPDMNQGLANASEVIEELIGEVPNLPLQQVFEKIIQRTGLLTCIMKDAEKHLLLAMLTSLFDFVKEETHRNPTLTVEGFVNLIAMMRKEKLILPFVQVSGSEKGINLMTAHGSKGLEFEYIFIAGTAAAFWEKKRKPSSGYKIPDTLIGSASTSSDDEELRRLFYVALTRAESHLYISYSRFNNGGKEMEPSKFIAEINDEHQLPIEKVIIDQEVADEFASMPFMQKAAPEISQLEIDIIQPILDKFVMNVTALNSYLNCPLGFYFKNLIRIPSPKNENTEFGSAVHFALERLFVRKKESGTDSFPTITVFIQDFEWFMHRHRESFTKEQFSRRMEYGKDVLTHYYEKYINTLNKVALPELNLKHIVVDGIPLKGKLDKLEFDGKQVNVVDYKTGDPEKSTSKLKGPSAKDPLGGDYWRQAVFYKILVDNYGQKDWQAISSEFDFIEPDNKKNYHKHKLVITPADIEIVREQVKETWQKIQNKEFYVGCGKETCHWCEFVKTNQLAVALHELTEESEDTE